MSKLETNTIDNISGSSTLTIGDSNASTISIPKNITLGASGTTITVPSGATITNNGTQTGFGGTNTPAFLARKEVDQSITHNVFTKIQFTDKIFDTDGTYDNSTNYRWTPGVVGKYVIGFGGWLYDANDAVTGYVISIYKNGSASTYFQTRIAGSGNAFQRIWLSGVYPIDVTSTSDYYEAYIEVTTSDSGDVNFNAASANFRNYFYGYKLIT